MINKLARLVLEADSRQIKTARSDLQDFEKQAAKVEKQAAALGKKIGQLAGAFATGMFVRSVIANTVAQEQAMAQLDATLKSTNQSAGITRDELLKMASGMQQVTTYGDETVIAAQSLLLTFTKIGKETFPDALEATLNVATAMGTDLKSAAIQVGKALNDPILGMTALSRSGIQFTDAQKDVVKQLVETGRGAEAQRIILAELETQFGGSARAARNTLGGALQSLKNAFGDLLEGDSGGDGVRGTTDAINQLTDTMNDPAVKAGFQAIVGGILNVIGAAARGVAELVSFTRWVGEAAAARISGPAIGDYVRITDAIAKQREEVEKLTRARDGARTTGRRDFLTGQIAEGQAELDRLQGMLKLTEEAAADTGRSLEVTAATMTTRVAPAIENTSRSTRKLRSEADQAAEAIRRQIDELLFQAETLGMSSDQVTIFRLRMQGATTDQLAMAQAALDSVAAFKQQEEAAKAVADEIEASQNRVNAAIAATPTMKLEETRNLMLELAAAYEQGRFGVVGSIEAVELFSETANTALGNNIEKVKELDTFAKTAAERIQGMFADALTDPFDSSIEEMGRKWAQMLHKMAAEALAAKLTQALFGQGTGGFSFLGKLGGFFGLKDIGGTVPAGGWAIAGERGPEIVKGPASVVSTRDTAKGSGGGSNVRIINAFDPSFIKDYLGSSEGDEIITNWVSRNQSAVRGALT